MIVTILLLHPQNPDVFLIFLYPLVLFARRVCNHIHLHCYAIHYTLYLMYFTYVLTLTVQAVRGALGRGPLYRSPGQQENETPTRSLSSPACRAPGQFLMVFKKQQPTMCLNYNSYHVSYETACDILLCIFRISILVEPCAAFECIFMPLQGLGSRTAFKNSFLLLCT